MIECVKMYLGPYKYKELHQYTRVEIDAIKLRVFNDEKVGKPAYRREHLILFQTEVIVGASLIPFTADQRRWRGKGDICISSKKKVTFVGLDLGEPVMPAGVIDTAKGIFNGTNKLPKERPEANECLLPIDRDNRTLIG